MAEQTIIIDKQGTERYNSFFYVETDNNTVLSDLDGWTLAMVTKFNELLIHILDSVGDSYLYLLERFLVRNISRS